MFVCILSSGSVLFFMAQLPLTLTPKKQKLKTVMVFYKDEDV